MITLKELRFPLRNLAAGIHTITLRRGTFIIIPSLLKYSLLLLVMNLTLTHVLNYPNPFVNYTEFWFTHIGLLSH
jgi:hypothetical protein